MKYLAVFCVSSKCARVHSCEIAETMGEVTVSPPCEKMWNNVVTIAEKLTPGDSGSIWQENVELNTAIRITAIFSRWQLYEEFLAEPDVQISVNGVIRSRIKRFTFKLEEM